MPTREALLKNPPSVTAIGLVMVYAAATRGAGLGSGDEAPSFLSMLDRQDVFAAGLCAWVVSGAFISTASLSATADERSATAAAAKNEEGGQQK